MKVASSLTDDGGCGLRRERPQHRAPPELLTLLVVAVLQQLEDTERLETLAFLHQPARPVLRTSAFLRRSASSFCFRCFSSTLSGPVPILAEPEPPELLLLRRSLA